MIFIYLACDSLLRFFYLPDSYIYSSHLPSASPACRSPSTLITSSRGSCSQPGALSDADTPSVHVCPSPTVYPASLTNTPYPRVCQATPLHSARGPRSLPPSWRLACRTRTVVSPCSSCGAARRTCRRRHRPTEPGGDATDAAHSGYGTGGRGRVVSILHDIARSERRVAL